MKKVFSLLLVVAMLVSMAVVASAAEPNAAGGMHTVITETDTDITVSVKVTNVSELSGVLNYLVFDTSKVSFVDGSIAKGSEFAAWNVTNSTGVKTDGNKVEIAPATNTDIRTYADTVEAFSYKLAKANADIELSEADFAYSVSNIKVSKVVTMPTTGTVGGVVAGTTFTTKTQPTYFTIEYVDARTPVVEEPDFGASVAGTTITCFGKVAATATNYGVEFTAESTVDGARAQKYYGAMPGDTVKDYNGSTTFTFGDWDGTFEIILEGVHAGDKELNFFVDDTVIADTNFTVNVQ